MKRLAGRRERGDRWHGHSRADLSPRLTGTLLGNGNHTAWPKKATYFLTYLLAFRKFNFNQSEFITRKTKIKGSSRRKGVGVKHMLGITVGRTWLSGHLYHLQPTTGYVACLKFALHSTVSGICELCPVTHMAPHLLSRTRQSAAFLHCRTSRTTTSLPLPCCTEGTAHTSFPISGAAGASR